MAAVAFQQTRLGLRALQFVLSAAALVLVSTSFKSIEQEVSSFYDTDVISTSLGSSAVTFAQIVSYSSMMYALWYLVAVEIYQYAPRLALQTDRVIDGVLAVLLFIAGIVLVFSDYVKHCSAIYFAVVRCGSIKAAVALLFIAMASFLVTFGTNYLSMARAAQAGGVATGHNHSHQHMTTETIEYVTVATPYQETVSPKDALSPIGNAKPAEQNV